jgi:hypothetical protein
MAAKTPPTLHATPPIRTVKTLSMAIPFTKPIVSPMTKRAETIFAAELCDLLRNQSSFLKNVSHAIPSIGAIPGTIHIHIVDGTKNGSPTQVAVVRFRHASHTEREMVFIIVRGSGVALREKWLIENVCEPTNMVQTRGIPTKDGNPILVHKGVLRGYRSVQPELRKIVQTCPAKTNIVIAGYGFGGAIANIAALDLVNRNRSDPYHVDIPIRLLTFSAPQYFANAVFHKSLRDMVPRYSAYSRAWDPVARMSSMDKIYSPPMRGTIWIHDNVTPKSTHHTRETVTIAPPARVALGCWPLCCGCGPRDDPGDHDIGRILGHLRIIV